MSEENIQILPKVKVCKRCGHDKSVILTSTEVCDNCKEPWADKKKYNVVLIIEHATTVEAYDKEDSIDEAISELSELDFERIEDSVTDSKSLEVKEK